IGRFWPATEVRASPAAPVRPYPSLLPHVRAAVPVSLATRSCGGTGLSCHTPVRWYRSSSPPLPQPRTACGQVDRLSLNIPSRSALLQLRDVGDLGVQGGESRFCIHGGCDPVRSGTEGDDALGSTRERGIGDDGPGRGR